MSLTNNEIIENFWNWLCLQRRGYGGKRFLATVRQLRVHIPLPLLRKDQTYHIFVAGNGFNSKNGLQFNLEGTHFIQFPGRRRYWDRVCPEVHRSDDVAKDDPWFQAFARATDKHELKIEPRIFPAGTDSRYIREIGIPAFGFSPMNFTPVRNPLHVYRHCGHPDWVRKMGNLDQRTLTYFIKGSITVKLTSCLTGLDSAALFMFN